MGASSGRLDGRNGDIWRAHISGETQESIAERLGITQQRVSQIIKAVRAGIPKPDVDEARQAHLDLSAMMRNELATLAQADPVQAYSNGRAMTNADGTPIMDHGGRITAMRELRAFMDRESKLLGMDAPEKIEHGLSDDVKAAQAQLAADALARMAERNG